DRPGRGAGWHLDGNRRPSGRWLQHRRLPGRHLHRERVRLAVGRGRARRHVGRPQAATAVRSRQSEAHRQHLLTAGRNKEGLAAAAGPFFSCMENAALRAGPMGRPRGASDQVVRAPTWWRTREAAPARTVAVSFRKARAARTEYPCGSGRSAARTDDPRGARRARRTLPGTWRDRRLHGDLRRYGWRIAGPNIARGPANQGPGL